jgi:hypothetical protein
MGMQMGGPPRNSLQDSQTSVADHQQRRNASRKGYTLQAEYSSVHHNLQNLHMRKVALHIFTIAIEAYRDPPASPE